jgi:hypothetical protein
LTAIGTATERLIGADIGRVVMDNSSARSLVSTSIRTAEGTLYAEMHGFSGVLSGRALDQFFAKPGVRAEVLAAEHVPLENLTLAREANGTFAAMDHSSVAAERGQLDFVHHGRYQHSKLIASSAGGPGATPVALFNNVKLTDLASSRPDLAATLQGRTAQAAIDVIHATMHGTPREVGRAVDDARTAGLLFNEEAVGATAVAPDLAVRRDYLAQGMRDLVRDAKETLVISSKGIDSPEFAQLLADAQQRGVKVGVSVRDLARSSAEVLDRNHVPTVLQPVRSDTSRINLIVADDTTAIASTAYQWNKQLGEVAGEFMPRDSGIVIKGDALDRLREQMRTTPVVRQAVYLLDHPEAGSVTKRTAHSWAPFPMTSFTNLADSWITGGQRLVPNLD